ncbi:MAG: hypothetical protein ACOYN5_06065 [Bacteroidales bacterium]
MKRNLLIIMMLMLSFGGLIAQNLKPYVLAFESTEKISDVRAKLEANLVKNGFEVLGQYQPANDQNRFLMVISSPELINAVKKVGGLTGFAAALRIAITIENSKTIVSYTQPAYWGNAYFRDDFDKVASEYGTFTSLLVITMKESGNFIGTGFGSADGISAADLREYHYMLGMPYFDDTVLLGEFNSYQTAIDKVELSIKTGVTNLKMVYKITIPGKDITLYGFALSGPSGESKFLPIVDQGSPKHTAFLPYEVLVSGRKVEMLHGRFRIALSFPELTMGTFSKIMSTPGDIEDLLKKLVEK